VRLPLWSTLLLACLGCTDDKNLTESPPVVSDLPKVQWTVTSVGLDRGHFTWDYEEIGMYHTHVVAVECSRGKQSELSFARIDCLEV